MRKNDKKDKNKDNKVRVSTFTVVVGFILFLAGCFVFAYPWLEVGEFNELFSFGTFIGLLAYLLLTLGLFLYSFINMWAIVVFDEKGLHKSLLGILFKKTILWEEIKDMRVLKMPSSAAMWVVFSKSDISGMGIGRCRLRRDNIYLMYSEKIQRLVTQYYGKPLK